MNTSKLQAFAAGARVELMKAVRAKLDAALEQNSAAQSDNPRAYQNLLDEISRNGGGEHGKAKTVERHAYRWFNRIIALRYMDANEFTSVHVVSGDEPDNPNALPAVLSAARRGEFDANVFDAYVGAKARILPTIQALLDGNKPSDDPQGDAYGLLLRAYCDYWHRFLPFMFDDVGDADEILMPADLLATDSVLRKAVGAMSVEDCVGGQGEGNVEIIGWLYQFYIAERKDEVMAGFRKSKKAGADEIPAATQLFTPDWIVKYLVQNTVGRLWTQNHPESRLHESWEYYIESSEEEQQQGSVLTIASPEELTVCDPACGSGHMLTYAFDLLYSIYDEAGYSANEIPGLILKHNLFGMEIDERAANLAAFALTMKARGKYHRFFRKGRQVQPNIQCIQPEYFTEEEVSELNELYDVILDSDSWNTYQNADVYGSLIQPDTELADWATTASAPSDEGAPGGAGWGRDGETATDLRLPPTRRLSAEPTGGEPTLFSGTLTDRAHTVLTQTTYLARKYAAVIANPPYMGTGNMGDLLKNWLNKKYKIGSKDLMTCFMLKAQSMVVAEGYWGMINLPSWISLSSFEELRKWLLSTAHIDSFIDLGRGIFGSDFGSVAFVMHNSSSDGRFGHYRRLFEKHVDVRSVETIRQLFLDKSYNSFTVNQHDFARIPGSPIVYWLPKSLLRVFNRKIAKGVSGEALSDIADVAKGFTTGDNARFLRVWWESSRSSIDLERTKLEEKQFGRWVPCDKGGEFHKWYGNNEYVIDWSRNGSVIFEFKGSTPRNRDITFKRSIACSKISSGQVSFRSHQGGFAFSDAAVGITDCASLPFAHCFLNSSTAVEIIQALSPTLNFEVGQLRSLPISFDADTPWLEAESSLVGSATTDWDSYETSWDFTNLEVLKYAGGTALSDAIPSYINHCKQIAEEQREREIKNNELVADAYGVRDEVPCNVPIERVSLKRNPAFAYPKNTPVERDELMARDLVKEIISYAVGCMFGRYSLDKPGLILASQGETLDDYREQIPNPTFEPDSDNVIPVTEDEWFEDDLAARFRQFLGVALGERYLEENIAYIEQVLGKSLRKYFVNDFYDDHVKMYKNRPIYWMYSSRTDKKGAFKALIYLHRYTPATTNNVLVYLRDFAAKLRAQSERLLESSKASEVRKGEKLQVAIRECVDYERDILYPLATRNLPIDLDDGVLVNYLRLGKALRTIPAIEKKRKTVQSWTWPTNPLGE
ncbi:hypothetical protein EP30_04845 [Bifidobacterium sp. UTCIF-39]|uniref:BREX-1 system adenine-specific DNA-methyltransferase PglX n=1 Tax=Bifidobacterium sp. UTCIF-39 TaxID=1465359 RepID=UPI00112609E1|nr:BREX-1 system adenine-specific DNA-methyltransferase PglX [Bifidobacterium sp. UTCIF-39]TPF97014.1 hypothetical protein EP30_04845 [Bifidobacterium sp. UTCIF-39]